MLHLSVPIIESNGWSVQFPVKEVSVKPASVKSSRLVGYSDPLGYLAELQGKLLTSRDGKNWSMPSLFNS